MKADIVLLVDGSSSIHASGMKVTGDTDYYRNFILSGLKLLASEFNVNKNDVHISILFFGDKKIGQTMKDVSLHESDFILNICQCLVSDYLQYQCRLNSGRR